MVDFLQVGLHLCQRFCSDFRFFGSKSRFGSGAGAGVFSFFTAGAGFTGSFVTAFFLGTAAGAGAGLAASLATGLAGGALGLAGDATAAGAAAAFAGADFAGFNATDCTITDFRTWRTGVADGWKKQKTIKLKCAATTASQMTHTERSHCNNRSKRSNLTTLG